MSTFSGPQGKGAMRRHRDNKRTEATARNAMPQTQSLVCGHRTTLDASDHLARCQVSA